MILDHFADLTRERIPTPAEFLGFVTGMGWRVVRRDDGSPALRAPRGDALAPKLARMLSREPYRTGVLALAMGGWRETPAPEPATPPRVREWLWPVTGMTYAERPEHAAEDAGDHPHGALWFREAGSSDWLPVPGRGDGRPPSAEVLSRSAGWADPACRDMADRVLASVRAERKAQAEPFAREGA